MAAEGRSALTKMLQDHQPVVDAFWREATGPLDLEWGDTGTAERKYEDGWGVAKISKKHSDALMRLPEIIACGAIYAHPKNPNRIVIIKGDTFAVFQKDGNGHFLFTGMRAVEKRYAADMRRGRMMEAGR